MLVRVCVVFFGGVVFVVLEVFGVVVLFLVWGWFGVDLWLLGLL